VVAAFETDDGRRILVDRGFIPEPLRQGPRPDGPAGVTGNLHWPEDTDSYTPPPDFARGIWFARDVTAMAEVLATEPVMLVQRSGSGAAADFAWPQPVDAAGIPNDHLGYAVTWFLLAAVWAGMTAFLVWRITRRPV
jgi:surfeit locus 1 family protein